MRRFSEEKELLDAGAEIVELVEHEGLHPTDAVVKVAKDRRVPAPWLPLLVSGYNITAAAQQRTTAESESVLDKLAHFPLAVVEDVEAAIYPEKTEKPSVLHHKTAVAREWTEPPRPARSPRKPVTIKQARAPEPPPEPTLPELRKTAGRLDAVIRAKHEEFEGCLGEIARHFRRPAVGTGFPAWEQAAILKHGEAGRTIAERVYDVGGLSLRGVRRCSGAPVYDSVDPNATPSKFLERAIKLAEEILDTGEKKAGVESEIRRYELDRVVPSIAREGSLGLWDGEVSEPGEKLAGIFGDVVGGAIGGSLVGDVKGTLFTPSQDLRDESKNKLYPPKQQRKLLGMNADFVLRDLMHNDEVVAAGQHTPEDISLAFNELSRTAPHAMQNPGVIRTMMRKRLSAGVLDPIDLDQLLKIERQFVGSNRPQREPDNA